MILIILFFLAVLKWHNYTRVYDIVETGVYANKDHSKPTKQCDHKVVTPQNSKQNKKKINYSNYQQKGIQMDQTNIRWRQTVDSLDAQQMDPLFVGYLG